MIFIFQTVLFKFLLITYTLSAEPSNCVTTNNGIVKGTQETTFHTDKTYFSYKGIPFAKPPLNELRFEPPQPVDNWDGILDATAHKAVCLQSYDTNVKTSIIAGSEDCLYLNVYTPLSPTETSENKTLAVMVWIHGGGFMGGDATTHLYSPDYLINEDVVVVSIAYRLNLFGFLTTGDLNYPGNNGLKDQILGLKWVKHNIAAFGGDPDRITIFGESAGGGSVSYLTQTSLTRGLYNQAIMHSGSSLCIWSLSRTSLEVLSNTGQLLGINATSSNDLVEQLKSVDYKTLHVASLLAANKIYSAYPIGGLANAPVIEPDHPDAVVTKRTIDILQSGDFNLTPMMMGINSFEGVDFQPVIEIMRLYFARINLDPVGLVPNNINVQSAATKETVGNLIKNHYFGDSNGTFTDRQYLHLVGDNYFVRDVLQTASLASNHTSVFLYHLSHLGNLGNPLRPYDYGVGHAEDLNYLFKRATTPVVLDVSDGLVRDKMVRLWTNFAKYGNPTPSLDDPLLDNIEWPETDSTLKYLDIGENLSTGANLHEHDYQFWMNIYDSYGRN